MSPATKLEVLTDSRPEPPDPAAPIRLRIKRRQLRRRGAAAVLVTAAAVALTVAAGPAIGALRAGPSGDPEFAAPPTSAPASTPAPRSPKVSTPVSTQGKVLPPPWSDKEFTRMPDANAYRPAYYVADGRIPTEKWAIISTQDSCLVSDEGKANSFGRPFDCFDEWTAGQTVSYTVNQAYAKEKNAPKVDHSLVLGAVSIESRTVRIVAGGKTYVTDAVGTPTTNRLRFFAIEIPKRDLTITSITPLDAANRPAPAPANPPARTTCTYSCGSPSGTPIN
ncbi:hypothetical protein F1D05_37085 [Kribbella qitaiheensis]|uniref:Uncharacterized protein n=1 Tax=Kribbella qitaiheensis TaxID=1544730 RepID=A0A7G6X8D0_9ACTN|nr:hypothetical protein [Kribbella qitaiheensis]QNE22495.1 hypothetical protein F1D05_37085 [Kribbella qitaiheensis]